MPLRIKKPVSVRKFEESISIRDAAGTTLAYVYFEAEPTRRSVTKRLGPEDAKENRQHRARGGSISLIAAVSLTTSQGYIRFGGEMLQNPPIPLLQNQLRQMRILFKNQRH